FNSLIGIFIKAQRRVLNSWRLIWISVLVPSKKTEPGARYWAKIDWNICIFYVTPFCRHRPAPNTDESPNDFGKNH
ncbi:hypothetical protein AAG617_27465, partial [Enterobacter cloacae]|uniref:hypothetical protein n=1 Tax=Enterobacter cloacae TaxID=550 RepID=UPI00315AA2A7